MSSRAKILAKVRLATSAGADETERKEVVEERLSTRASGVIPARGQLEHKAKVDLFQEEAERVAAKVTRLASLGDLPAAVSDYLRANNLPQSIKMGADKTLQDAPWASNPTLEVTHGPSDGNDIATISHALCGVAETGTLILGSGAENPTTLNFLPDYHIVVVSTDEIEGDFEAAMARLRSRYGDAGLPRTVNMVTGPSRSADIEQTLLLGAHGPRQLQIYIIEE